MTRTRNKPAPAIALVATWAGAFFWLGWRGLVVAVIAGLVTAIGTLVNAQPFLRNHSKKETCR